ncbi:MAG: hypothetical protein ACTHJG_00140 [Rhodanobacteraceae bacterium]
MSTQRDSIVDAWAASFKNVFAAHADAFATAWDARDGEALTHLRHEFDGAARDFLALVDLARGNAEREARLAAGDACKLAERAQRIQRIVESKAAHG